MISLSGCSRSDSHISGTNSLLAGPHYIPGNPTQYHSGEGQTRALLSGEAVERVQCHLPGQLSAGAAGLEGLRAEDQEQVHDQWETGMDRGWEITFLHSNFS